MPSILILDNMCVTYIVEHQKFNKSSYVYLLPMLRIEGAIEFLNFQANIYAEKGI